ncbi:hypothetical protein HDU99_010143, partial [Rhizoclosmatium hyalinum]
PIEDGCYPIHDACRDDDFLPHPVYVSIPAPTYVNYFLIAATLSLLASFITFQYDLHLVEHAMHTFKIARNAFFAKLIRLSRKSPEFGACLLWTGDIDNDEEEKPAALGVYPGAQNQTHTH